jgi:Trk K+ transport system NAD-binding subunit
MLLRIAIEISAGDVFVFATRHDDLARSPTDWNRRNVSAEASIARLRNDDPADVHDVGKATPSACAYRSMALT